MSHECREIAHIFLQNNAYWAHPENILLAALFDMDRSNRETGITKIIEARKAANEQSQIRVYKPPKLNFSADCYLSVID